MGPEFHITSDQLLCVIGTQHATSIVDICTCEDHALDPRVIPGAWRCAFGDAGERIFDGPVVIVCQKGLKLSQGVTALLRQRGIDARFLTGGMLHWADTGLPLIETNAHPAIGMGEQRWALPIKLTPKIMFQAWCVVRFVDPEPIWMHVEAAQIARVADRFAAHKLAHAAVAVRAAIPQISSQEDSVSEQPLYDLLYAACSGFVDPSQNLSQGFAIVDASWSVIWRGDRP